MVCGFIRRRVDGARFMPGAWYESLTKPSWNSSNAIFGPVWFAAGDFSPETLSERNKLWVFRVLCGSLFSVPNSAHVTILFFFCTPVHSSAQGMIAVTDNRTFRAAQHFPSPGGTVSAVSAELCRSIGLF
jgi:hypothetical protein